MRLLWRPGEALVKQPPDISSEDLLIRKRLPRDWIVMTDLPSSKHQDVHIAIHLGYLVQVSLRDTEPRFYACTKACIGWLSVPLRCYLAIEIRSFFFDISIDIPFLITFLMYAIYTIWAYSANEFSIVIQIRRKLRFVSSKFHKNERYTFFSRLQSSRRTCMCNIMGKRMNGLSWNFRDRLSMDTLQIIKPASNDFAYFSQFFPKFNVIGCATSL